MSFIDKEQLLRDYYQPALLEGRDLPLNKKLSVPRQNLLKRFLYEKETFSMLLTPYGYELKFYTDEELYDAFGDTLPDCIEGDVLVFFNTEDACRILGLK